MGGTTQKYRLMADISHLSNGLPVATIQVTEQWEPDGWRTSTHMYVYPVCIPEAGPKQKAALIQLRNLVEAANRGLSVPPRPLESGSGKS